MKTAMNCCSRWMSWTVTNVIDRVIMKRKIASAIFSGIIFSNYSNIQDHKTEVDNFRIVR